MSSWVTVFLQSVPQFTIFTVEELQGDSTASIIHVLMDMLSAGCRSPITGQLVPSLLVAYIELEGASGDTYSTDKVPSETA